VKNSRPVLMAPVERMVFFSDAAVAIALTLLILPLMDGVSQAAKDGLGAVGYLGQNTNALVSFALSFVIIARFWRAHHRLFNDIERETPGLFWLNMAWLASIVLLPVATAMTGSLKHDPVQYVIYIGTMLATTMCMTAMIWLLRRTPQTWAEGHSVPTSGLRSSLILVLLLVIALLIAVLIPGAGYWSLLALTIARPARWGLDRLLDGNPDHSNPDHPNPDQPEPALTTVPPVSGAES